MRRLDRHGQHQAIESSNSMYQVALFTVHAEVQITDADHPEQALQVLTGRPAIARWIEDMAARQIVHHVVDLKADRRS